MNNLSTSKNVTEFDNKEDEKNNEINEAKEELPIVKNETESAEKIEDENKLINNRNPNLKNKEFEFKNFMEINNEYIIYKLINTNFGDPISSILLTPGHVIIGTMLGQISYLTLSSNKISIYILLFSKIYSSIFASLQYFLNSALFFL